MKTASKTLKLKVVMKLTGMLKWFSAAVVGFSATNAHAAWFCPTCHVKHEEEICPNANTTDKFGIWQPTWWCDACQAIHFPKQWWWDGEQLLVTCKNGCWPCQTCNAVHTAEDAFTQNAWCCPTCRTKHTGGQSYCEKKQGNNEKKVWFCTSCNKPHGTYQPCESAWFCDACEKGHPIGTICQTGRWYCSACQKSYKANESCEHSWNCPQEGGCGKTHRFDEICPKGNMYCLSCKDVLLKGNSCDHYWTCPACNKHHASDETCPNNYWYCTKCKEAKEAEQECEHAWYCSVCHGSYAIGSPCACGTFYCQSEDLRLKTGENCEHYWYCNICKIHHAANFVCTASIPNRWFCPNEACRASYEVGKACGHSWYCTTCTGRHALNEACPAKRFWCAQCEAILEPNGNCEHYWYCTIETTHHAADVVCTATTPHRWYCPTCKTAVDVGKACGHSWYCEGCQTRHALDATCPEGYLYCANEDCKKVLTVTESCLHYWACPVCVKTHHAAEDTCPNGYWFCIDCFTTDPTTGIYGQTDGCPHHWWCENCNENAGMRYAADDVCDHRWGCSVDKIGHTDTEKCDARLWYCRGDGCNCRYNSQDTACCNHTWYCPHHQYGHKITDGSCETNWYCPECTDENKIHAVEDATYCDHSWYCTECHKGHLLTEACPQGYWFCKTCNEHYNSTETPSDVHSWYCYIDENNPGCKVGHLKTEPCTQHYRWCGEEGCNCVYPPNTPCVHCWECPSCYQAYGRNEACPTDQTWCCGCLAVRDFQTDAFCTLCHRWACDTCHSTQTKDEVCQHSWYCYADRLIRPINTMCTNCIRFGCSECKSVSSGLWGNCCPHYWVCCGCNPRTFHTKDDAVCPNCNTGWFCPDCNNGNGYVYTNSYYCNSATIIHFWRCDTEHLRVPVSKSCSGCNYWFCTICKSTYYNDEDEQGHRRPNAVNNAPLLHAKKAFLKESPFINDIPLLNVFKENNKPFEEVHSSNDVPEEKNLIDTAEERHSDGDQTNQPMLRTMEKLKRKKNKLFQSHEEDSKEKPKHSSSSSSSSKDKDIKPYKKFVINMRKKDSDDEDPKDFDLKNPLRKTIRFGEHSHFNRNDSKHTNKKQTNINVQTSALKKSNLNGLETGGMQPNIGRPINASKVELKSSKQSNEKKYPQLTQSHIKYSEKQEDSKQSSPGSSPKSNDKSGSSSDSDTSKSKLAEDKKEEGKNPRLSKVECPKLQYNINLDALMSKIKEEPFLISGVSNFGKAEEAKEQSRVSELKLKLKQMSKVQSSLHPKTNKDGTSIVPPISKVIKGGENKKEDDPFASSDHKASKKQSTFNPSSVGSDSDVSETPEGNAKGSKIYTNKPTDNLQKSTFKKIYKEDEGHETPSDSLSGSKFNLLKSSKNKKSSKDRNAAPNASDVNAKTKLPPASDSSQQFEFKTIEGPKEVSKINENAPKSNNETPTPNGETPKEETPKSGKINASDEEKKSSSSRHVSKKSVTSTLKNEDQKSESGKQSDAEVSEKSDEENKSEKSNASDEEKKSSHSKFSKSSSKKSEKSGSEDEDSEKHSDSESLKSDKGSNKEGKSSEYNESSEEENEHSEEEEENSKEKSENSEISGK